MAPQLNYQGVEFPVNVKHYSKIEKQNSININVFGYEEEQFYPIYISKEMNDKVLNLLLITKVEKQHYVLIKDFNKMMYNKTKHKQRKHFCMFCLQCFSADKILEKHKSNCMVINGQQAIKMPEPGSKIEFNNHHKQMLAPFVIYADFEAKQRKYLDVNQIVSNLILINTNNIQAVLMVINWYVVMMINIQNQ